jgi:hypothetical protein
MPQRRWTDGPRGDNANLKFLRTVSGVAKTYPRRSVYLPSLPTIKMADLITAVPPALAALKPYLLRASQFEKGSEFDILLDRLAPCHSTWSSNGQAWRACFAFS